MTRCMLKFFVYTSCNYNKWICWHQHITSFSQQSCYCPLDDIGIL